MALTSVIQPYDPSWPAQFAAEVARLSPIFGAALVRIDHVGSTAVPALAAKPEIDLLAVVDEAGDLEQWTRAFAALGYRRGGDLSPGHRFFKRDVDGVRTHKVHVCDLGHASVGEMLAFRDHLRVDAAARDAYQALKLRLERENTDGIGQYLAGKQPFIEAVLARIASA
ncbi:MAG TPA: GrpB family protein [Caulobacteraceae bacterium]|nr:GrpB family protein [Caulobacteraceae bacterium]